MTSPIERPPWLPYQAYPFELRSLDLPSGNVGYIDEGEGPTLLFVHAGMWSFLWRDVIVRLRSEFRAVAVDFPGFGLSPDGHADPTLVSLSVTLQEFVAALDLTEVTVVAHDLGGPVALGAAASDPARYQGLVLTNTFAWEPEARSLRGMLATMGSRPVEWLDVRTNLMPLMTSTRFGIGRHLSTPGRRAFRGPYADRSRRRGVHQLMRSAISSPEHMALVEAATNNELNDLPVLTIFGARNDPWKFQQRHAETFPDHEGHVIPKSYHFPMMDEPDRFADLIRDWVARRDELVVSRDGQRSAVVERRRPEPSALSKGG